MWRTLFRGMSGDKREDGFFPTVTRFSGAMTARDMYASTRLAAVEGQVSHHSQSRACRGGHPRYQRYRSARPLVVWAGDRSVTRADHQAR
jgi:hypothetical protein